MKTRTVQDLMTQNPTCCSPTDPISQVARMMVEEDCGAIPVVDNPQDNNLVGIITDRDIVCRIVAKDLDPGTATVQQAMSSDMVTLSPESSLEECVRQMGQEQVRRMPVTDRDGKILGIVSQADLARASSEEDRLEDDLAEMVEEVSEPTLGVR